MECTSGLVKGGEGRLGSKWTWADNHLVPGSVHKRSKEARDETDKTQFTKRRARVGRARDGRD